MFWRSKRIKCYGTFATQAEAAKVARKSKPLFDAEFPRSLTKLGCKGVFKYTSEMEAKRALWKRVEPTLKAMPNGCRIFTGQLNNRGYPFTPIRFAGRNTRVSMHRVALEVKRGQLLGKLFCCHHCDTPACCNPAHLFAGTARDNVRDCLSKGRHASQKKRQSQTARRPRGLIITQNPHESIHPSETPHA